MTTLHKIVAFGQMTEQDAQKAGLREGRNWHDALIMVSTLLLVVVLVVGLAWMARRDQKGWEHVEGGKQDRAGNVGSRFVLNQKE